MKVRLSNCGNIDFGQNPNRPLPGTRTRTVRVKDFAEASAVCRRYIAENGLGGGNWTGGEITDEATGKVIGRVSYNGRVWGPEEWTPDSKPIYVP